MNITELKALAYDTIAMSEKCQKDLRVINSIIQEKNNVSAGKDQKTLEDNKEPAGSLGNSEKPNTKP